MCSSDLQGGRVSGIRWPWGKAADEGKVHVDGLANLKSCNTHPLAKVRDLLVWRPTKRSTLGEVYGADARAPKTAETDKVDETVSVSSGSEVSSLTTSTAVAEVGDSVTATGYSRTGDRPNLWKKPLRRTLWVTGQAAAFGGVLLGCGKIALVISPVTMGVMWALRDKKPCLESDIILSIANGDAVVEEEIKESTCEDGGARSVVCGGRDDRAVVKVESKPYWWRLRKPPVRRVPVVAGEIAQGLKVRHGMILDTVENRRLIRSDAARRCEALRRDGDPWFVNMRNHDMHLVVMHASQMFWLLTDDEEALYESYALQNVAANRGRRARYATFHQAS